MTAAVASHEFRRKASGGADPWQRPAIANGPRDAPATGRPLRDGSVIAIIDLGRHHHPEPDRTTVSAIPEVDTAERRPQEARPKLDRPRRPALPARSRRISRRATFALRSRESPRCPSMTPRSEANSTHRQAYRTGSTKLDLSGLGLKSVPESIRRLAGPPVARPRRQSADGVARARLANSPASSRSSSARIR